jgi:hypothetical protein
VDTEIAVVLVHPLQGGQVGGVGDNLIDPLAGSNSGVSIRAFKFRIMEYALFAVRSSEILEGELVVELSDVNFSFYSHASGHLSPLLLLACSPISMSAAYPMTQ